MLRVNRGAISVQPMSGDYAKRAAGQCALLRPSASQKVFNGTEILRISYVHRADTNNNIRKQQAIINYEQQNDY